MKRTAHSPQRPRPAQKARFGHKFSRNIAWARVNLGLASIKRVFPEASPRRIWFSKLQDHLFREDRKKCPGPTRKKHHLLSCLTMVPFSPHFGHFWGLHRPSFFSPHLEQINSAMIRSLRLSFKSLLILNHSSRQAFFHCPPRGRRTEDGGRRTDLNLPTAHYPLFTIHYHCRLPTLLANLDMVSKTSHRAACTMSFCLSTGRYGRQGQAGWSRDCCSGCRTGKTLTRPALISQQAYLIFNRIAGSKLTAKHPLSLFDSFE